MLDGLKRLFKKDRPDEVDSQRLYQFAMAQSRRPEFFGPGRVPDSYDGRIDLLSLNLTLIMFGLRRHAEQGERLSQAIYDRMIDDFDMALREEGLADTGIKRRIKPMAKLFFTRAKRYTDALNGDSDPLNIVFEDNILKGISDSDAFAQTLSDYSQQTILILSKLTLGQIALTEWAFPPIITPQ